MNIPTLQDSNQKFNLHSVKHIIAVAAGKGGVGKSSVCVNLAFALERLGERVGILDADLYGPSLQKMVPEEIPPGQSLDRQDHIVPAYVGGIKMISMAHFEDSPDRFFVRAPIANRVIFQFIHKIDWGELDYLLIDFPPGTGDIHLTLIQEALLSGAILVATPQDVALLDVKKTSAMFQKMNVPLFGIIENMSYFSPDGSDQKYYPFGKGGEEKLSRELGIPYLGEIPLDPTISLCSDQGLCLLDRYPKRQSAMNFISIAKEIQKKMKPIEKQMKGSLGHFELVFNEASHE